MPNHKPAPEGDRSEVSPKVGRKEAPHDGDATRSSRHVAANDLAAAFGEKKPNEKQEALREITEFFSRHSPIEPCRPHSPLPPQEASSSNLHSTSPEAGSSSNFPNVNSPEIEPQTPNQASVDYEEQLKSLPGFSPGTAEKIETFFETN